MTLNESNNSNAIEIDGIQFETVVSQSVLTIPEAKRGVFTPIQLGIRIINNTQKSFYFSSNFYSIFPEMIAPDGQLMQTGIDCARLNPPLESDFYLVLPQKEVTLSCNAFLYWIQNPKKKRDRNLVLNIPFPSEDIYSFSLLYLGRYQFRFKYYESGEGIEELTHLIEPATLQKISQNLWIGEVITPLLDIQLVQS